MRDECANEAITPDCDARPMSERRATIDEQIEKKHQECDQHYDEYKALLKKRELFKAAKPLMDFLRYQGNPHQTIFVTSECAELVSGYEMVAHRNQM